MGRKCPFALSVFDLVSTCASFVGILKFTKIVEQADSLVTYYAG